MPRFLFLLAACTIYLLSVACGDDVVVTKKFSPALKPEEIAKKRLDKILSPPPSWMVEQVREDLANFATASVSSEEIDTLMANELKVDNRYNLVRYQIEGKKVVETTDHLPEGTLRNRLPPVTEAFEELARIVPLKKVDFVVSLRDSADLHPFPIPIFAFAKTSDPQNKVVLIPDFEALEGHAKTLKEVQAGNLRYPWNKKMNQAMWRGVTTGGRFTQQNFLTFPRTKSVSDSLEHPDLVDSRFTSLVQCDDECNGIKQKFEKYFGNFLSIEDQLKYKYQLLIDGNSCAYSRAYWQLFSNTVVFKQESQSIQWYYKGLVPNVHYISLQSNLSDLVEKIQWAKSHDKDLLQISKNARAFATNHLDHDAILQYLYVLLTEYSSRLTSQPSN